MIEIVTIFCFAVLQSIFGIGILFFGTPTLIILGYPFAETLSVLLPASIAVSLLQVWQSDRPAPPFVRDFALWCLLPLGVALAGVLALGWNIELELVIALTLLLYVVIRVSARSQDALRRLVRRYPRLCLPLIGVVHGLSNLGGGLLGIFAANTFEDKTAIRGHIAFCYLFFAVLQLGTLAVLVPGVMHAAQIGYAALAGAVFLLLERRIFRAIPGPVFDSLFTVIIGAYSALVFLKLLGLFEELPLA